MIALIRTVAAVLFTCVFAFLEALIGFPATWLTGSADTLFAIAMWITRSGLSVAGIRIAVEGLEQIDRDATYIFMCNHVSNLDPPILIQIGRASCRERV